MCGVDERLLHAEENAHHVLRETRLPIQQLQRLANHRVAQQGEVLELGHRQVADHRLELVPHLLHAQETRLRERVETVQNQLLQRLLRDEQTSVDTAIVHDRRADLADTHTSARIDRLQRAGEVAGEDLHDARATGQFLRVVAFSAEENGLQLLREIDEDLHGTRVHVRQTVVHGLDLRQLSADLSAVLRHLLDDLRQRLADVAHQQLVQALAQVLRPHAFATVWIVRLEEASLVLPLPVHVLALVDVVLAAVDHAHVAQLQRNHATVEDVARVRPLVHDIHLRDHADRPLARRIVLLCQLDGIAQRQIRVRGRHCHDDTRRLANVPHHHVAQNLFDVARLVSHGVSRDSGKIDQRQVHDVRRVNLQVDRFVRHADARSRLALGLTHDLLPNLVKVIELLCWLVGKHCVVCASFPSQTPHPQADLLRIQVAARVDTV